MILQDFERADLSKSCEEYIREFDKSNDLHVKMVEAQAAFQEQQTFVRKISETLGRRINNEGCVVLNEKVLIGVQASTASNTYFVEIKRKAVR